jgi:hypothetical protein
LLFDRKRQPFRERGLMALPEGSVGLGLAKHRG